ncbi:MAG: hypothetical protein ACXVRI_07215 [Gaiellaceae bacterium]
MTAVLAFSAAASAQPQTSTAAVGVAKGAPWNYKGQKGTAYSVVGVNGASCAIGLKYMPKWTRDRATLDLEPVPAGWHCSAIGGGGLAKLGQCTTTKGGIFEWLPKQKK